MPAATATDSALEDILTSARSWIADCTDVIDLEDLDLTDSEVRRYIDREYVGGWRGFEHAHHTATTDTDRI